uniref:Survival of motor neuron-related-splicing factor 30 n=1 Tax=Polytomella parva TaxID=51329 RepID=A0A7S0VKM0_9CHLO|mmetsp:Transcript_7952/g.15470  ORF Transcript_7952/g.15470 Transcript_7952/m.15470 type:complete len:312 (+) Transcript_7952:94-1029(+)
MSELQSIEELEENLKVYRQQLEEIGQIILQDGEGDEDPDQELQDLYHNLEELIELNEDLLKDAIATRKSSSNIEEPILPSLAAPVASVAVTTAPELILPASLPPQVADQIRRAQAKAALLGRKPPAWAIGSKCQAIYAADGLYYDARIEGISSTGNFIVVYEGYTEKGEVPLSRIRPAPEKEEIYTGVAAPKRQRVNDSSESIEIPKWLTIKDTDDEKTKALKRKKLRSYKSKQRFHKMEQDQKEKASDWQSFLKTKGSKHRAGFFTGTRKQSIFATSTEVNSKVGVVGSGRGVTGNQKRVRQIFEKEDEE